MLSQWSLIALYGAAPLVVAIAILIGARLPNGTITITSGAAVVALTIFFAFLGGGPGQRCWLWRHISRSARSSPSPCG